MVNWNKPILFTKVHDNNHAAYQPKLVGSFIDNENNLRLVIVARNWLSRDGGGYSFLVYREDGSIVEPHSDTKATGILDATIVNGFVSGEATNQGVGVNVTYIDDVPVAVMLA